MQGPQLSFLHCFTANYLRELEPGSASMSMGGSLRFAIDGQPSSCLTLLDLSAGRAGDHDGGIVIRARDLDLGLMSIRWAWQACCSWL